MPWPQAQQAAASLGVPALANVFYYGKDFSSQKQKLTKKGTVAPEEFRPLSVTKPGAAGEMMEDKEVAERTQSKENAADYLEQMFAQEEGPSIDDLLKIIRRG
jgi:hypothetical protein